MLITNQNYFAQTAQTRATQNKHKDISFQKKFQGIDIPRAQNQMFVSGLEKAQAAATNGWGQCDAPLIDYFNGVKKCFPDKGEFIRYTGGLINERPQEERRTLIQIRNFVNQFTSGASRH